MAAIENSKLGGWTGIRKTKAKGSPIQFLRVKEFIDRLNTAMATP
jgi:hypothetical protein